MTLNKFKAVIRRKHEPEVADEIRQNAVVVFVVVVVVVFVVFSVVVVVVVTNVVAS